MNQLDKEFIPYEQALALKELGFDEPCLAYYTTTNDVAIDKEGNKTNFILLSSKLRGELVGHGSVKNSLFKWLKENDKTSGELYTLSNSMTAPLYQQAFRWFREKYNIDSMIQPTYSTKYKYRIFHIEDKIKVQIYGEYMGKEFKSYEEAKLACLIKLIQIVKEK